MNQPTKTSILQVVSTKQLDICLLTDKNEIHRFKFDNNVFYKDEKEALLVGINLGLMISKGKSQYSVNIETPDYDVVKLLSNRTNKIDDLTQYYMNVINLTIDKMDWVGIRELGYNMNLD